MTDNQTSTKEKMVLEHEPLPGYKTAFYLAVALGLTYLILVFTGVVGP